MEDEYLSYYMIRDSDLYLVPICLVVLYFLAYLFRKSYRGSPLQRYIFPALTIRFACAFIYILVIGYYYGFGDTHNYYQGVLDMHKAVSQDNSFLVDIYSKNSLERTDRIYPFFMYDNYGVTQYYMLEPRTYMVPRLALPFSLLFDKSLLCISFCISFFAFLGSWRILKMFYELYPHLHRKLAIATLFLPSILFWGVSLLKDPICLGAMGFFLYALYSIFIKKKKIIASLIIIYLSGFLLYYTKSYILLCISAVFLLWIFLRFRDKIEDRTLRTISTGLFVAIALFAGYLITQSLAQSEQAARFSADEILNTVESQQATFSRNTGQAEGGGSNFGLGISTTSPLGLLALFPLGIINTYFRPFPWDVGSPLMVLSALEAFAFLALTFKCFRRVGFGKTFNIIFSDPVIAFCFVFAILFGGIIGATTTNFGALIRYKIPCIPFYAIAFFLVMDKSGKFSNKYIFGKKLF